MAKTLVKAGYEVHILEWDRDSHLQPLEWVDKVLAHRFRVKAPYGWKLIYQLPLWYFYVTIFCLVKRFDIIQPQNLDNLIPIWLLRRIKNFRIVYDIADFYADAYIPTNAFLLRKLTRYLEVLLVMRVNATIIADEVRIKQIGFKPKNLCVIYNSPPDVYGKLRARTRGKLLSRLCTAIKTNSHFTIFYGGAIDDGRGLYHLVEVCQRVSDVTLMIAGFGRLEKHFLNFIKAKKNILFLGRISYQEVLNCTMKCDCVVVLYDPRIPNMVYASPNKLFEAMMCGKPVVVSAGTVMASTVWREKCGLVVNYSDLNELKRAIELLKNNPDLASSLGKNGRKAYLEKYNWLTMEKRLLQLYSSIVKQT
jgi:glycosyltransferase involved in cell wall biosynthesis